MQRADGAVPVPVGPLVGAFERTIDWREGFAVALGVPVLILPSIGYFAGCVGSFAVVVWLLSVLQGFLQNTAYGELASRYADVSGLLGFVQRVFKGRTERRYSLGGFVGGFSAWGYWFAWNPVLAIFSLLIGKYLHGLVPLFAGVPDSTLSLLTGLCWLKSPSGCAKWREKRTCARVTPGNLGFLAPQHPTSSGL